MKQEQIQIDAGKRGTVLPHFWSRCIGAGRANEGLRAAWQRQLKAVHEECGFEYIRFHGLLCDDMVVYWEEQGEPVYNWSYIDELFDFLVEIGMKPFVEFGFMPEALASGTGTQFWWKGNITPEMGGSSESGSRTLDRQVRDRRSKDLVFRDLERAGSVGVLERDQKPVF